MDGGKAARHYIITGRVQGVGFRAWTKREADNLGLRGTVRNTPDRHVEVFAMGPESTLEDFEQRLKRGPLASKVVSIEASPTASGDWEGFQIIA